MTGNKQLRPKTAGEPINVGILNSNTELSGINSNMDNINEVYQN